MKKKLYLLLVVITTVFSACTDEAIDIPGTDARDKFIGAWLCKETISGTTMSFTITFYKVGESDTVQIYNFSNYGSSAVATGYVSGSSLTIPAQQIGVTNIDIGGSGVYSNTSGTEKITMNYMTDGTSATAICTK